MMVELNEKDLLKINGGFVITGTVVASVVGAFASGVTVGYAIGTYVKNKK